jgi:hypothetical protein
MATICAEVNSDPVGTRAFAGRSRCENVRLAVGRIYHVDVSSLPERSCMIDVYT